MTTIKLHIHQRCGKKQSVTIMRPVTHIHRIHPSLASLAPVLYVGCYFPRVPLSFLAHFSGFAASNSSELTRSHKITLTLAF